MEPETSRQEINPEFSPFQPEIQPENQETQASGIENGAEKFEQRSEASALDVAQFSAAPTLPKPVVTDDDASQSVPVVGDTDYPVIADDVDLIEKEWVDKAKKIISETSDDPHAREEKVSKLQEDYLYKRYGKQIGEAEGSS